MAYPLFVFDFDHSLCHQNDVDRQFLAAFVPLDIQNTLRTKYLSWNSFINASYQYAFSQGVTKNQIISNLLATCAIDDEIIATIRMVMERGAEVIILSNGNQMMIEQVLSNMQLEVTDVLTNPSYFRDDGCLVLSKYHLEPHGCDRCPDNLCKSRALIDYGHLGPIMYVGDGIGDGCPIINFLGRRGDRRDDVGDIALIRSGFDLDKHLQNNPADYSRIKANIIYWEGPQDICEQMQQFVQNFATS